MLYIYANYKFKLWSVLISFCVISCYSTNYIPDEKLLFY